MHAPNHRAAVTRANVRLLRHIGVAKRPRVRLPRQIQPRAIEREYARALLSLVDAMRQAFQPVYDAIPGLVELAAALRRVDAEDDRRLNELIDRVGKDLREKVRLPERVSALASDFGIRTARFQKEQLGRQVKAGLGTELFLRDEKVGPILDGFITENRFLAQSLEREVLSNVESTFARGIRAGQGAREIGKQLDEIFDKAEGRGTRIARDQVLSLYGQVNAVRQQELGVERFTWRTVGDEAVRDEHRELNGEVFRYDDPPEEGLPGEAINCRCSAEPVLSDLLDE